MLILCQFVPAQTNEIKKTESRPEFETELIAEINGARQNPAKYSKYVQGYTGLMRGKVLYLPKRPPFLTNEGEAVLKETAEALVASPELLPLFKSEILESVARAQLNDLLEDPGLGHKGKDGANLATRLARFGKNEGAVGENITLF